MPIVEDAATPFAPDAGVDREAIIDRAMSAAACELASRSRAVARLRIEVSSAV